MDTITNCPKCSAAIAPLDFVCDYCGNVIFERVRSTDDLNAGKASFDKGIEIIKENLDALYDLPKPSTDAILKSSFRLILALFTLGIILIFWHRPKKRFIKENYDKLKSILFRDISFLKISSEGSKDLTDRIEVLENELKQIDRKVKASLTTKTVTRYSIIALYILWIFYIASLGPKSYATYHTSPFDSIARGNISRHIIISPDSAKITHAPSGSFEEWEMQIKLQINKIDSAPVKGLNLKVELILADQKGIPVPGFVPGELEESSGDKLKSSLINGNQKEEFYKFYIKSDFNYTEYMDTIPAEAKKFIIHADTSFSMTHQ